MANASYITGKQRPVPWSSMAHIGLAALAGVAVIWLIAVPLGPEACALSFPGPRNCFVSQRMDAATLPTVLLVALAVVSMVVALVWSRKARTVRSVAVIALLVATVAAYLLVAWIPALAWIGRVGVDLYP